MWTDAVFMLACVGGCDGLRGQSNAGWEEYVDYIFPDDEKGVGSLKLLENAAKWNANRLLATVRGATGAAKRKAEDDPDAEDGDGPAGAGSGAGAPGAGVVPVSDADAVNIDDI